MREELNVDAEDEDEDEEEEEEDEDEDEGTVIEAQLRHIWHLVADGVDRVDREEPAPTPSGVRPEAQLREGRSAGVQRRASAHEDVRRDRLAVDGAQLDLALEIPDHRGADVDVVQLVDVRDAARSRTR